MTFGITNVLLVLNGHVVEGGYSDDADALMFEPIELVGERREGADGSVAYFGSGSKGGTFTLKLLPNSPSVPHFQQQAEIVRRGGSVIWSGTIRDTQVGISAALINGALQSFMPFPSYGKNAISNYEYPFLFEGIVPNYDAVAAGAFSAVSA